jgi:tetratricopeptide (TPR) repeat protein
MKILKIVLPFLAFIIPFGVYLYTVSPAVMPGDSTEMVTAAIVLGVPHQPSYPVNTLIGYLASKMDGIKELSFSSSKLSFQDTNVVERVNGVSALLQALTVLCFYLLLLELFRSASMLSIQGELSFSDRIVAFTASMFLAFSLIFWMYATKFEVFPLNNLLVVILMLLATKLNQVKAKLSRRDIGGFGLLAFLAGFAFTHHQTILFIFPAILFLIWKKIIGFLARLSGWLVAFVGLLAGVVPFFGLLIWIASKKPLMNWGEIEGIPGAFAALVRKDFGTFSSFLVGNAPVVRQAPIEQIPFYLHWMVFDFSVIGILFVLVGIWYLWKLQRRLFWFVTVGFFLSGFGFLMYANFPLSDSFNQVTVRRFHMLPNLFVAIFLAFGLRYLYQRLASIKVRDGEKKLGITLGKVFLFSLFLFPLGMNFSKANNRGNTLTEQYSQQTYRTTPDNALILLSGDIPNMTADYFRDVEMGGSDSRITFTPGQFHLPWFTPQLRRKYPDLVIPEPKPGKQFTTATQIIEANFGKWPMYVGPDLVVNDPELEEKYVLYPKNLLFLVKQKGEDLQLEEWRTENEALWEGIDLPQLRIVKRNSPLFEETIVFHYARHFHNSGYVYEEVGLFDDAIREYKRVLEIDPFFKEALAALARVYGEKLEQPDYVAAVTYLNRYLSVLQKGEEEYGYAAVAKIAEYEEKFAELMKEDAAESTDSAFPIEQASPSAGDIESRD